MNDKFPIRKKTRLKVYDYDTPGAYFITICTKDRKQILSTIKQDNLPSAGKMTSHAVGTDVPGGPLLTLTKYGIIADKYIKKLDEFYDDISVEKYVIMPNHIHFLLIISGPPRTSVPTAEGDGLLSEQSNCGSGAFGPPRNTATGGAVNYPPTPCVMVPTAETDTITPTQKTLISKFISTFKRFTNKEYGENIWQLRSYDHVVRNKQDHNEIVKYIYENPIRWYYDELYTE